VPAGRSILTTASLLAVRICLAGIACIAALAGCGGSSAPSQPAEKTPQPVASTPTPTKPAPTLVYLLTATGADPLGVETVVTRDGHVFSIVDGGRAGGEKTQKKLPAATFARLRRLVAHADLAHADRSRTPVPGGSTYTLRIGQKSAIFSTGHTARNIRPLLAALVRLRDKTVAG
jgi:hypothetical protein